MVDPGDGIFAGVIVARFIGTRQPLGSYSIYSILLPNKIQFKPLTAKFTAWLACVAGAWNSKWAQEGTGARGRHARGEGSPARKGLRKSFQLAFCECGYFQFVERLPREKVIALGEKTVNQ